MRCGWGSGTRLTASQMLAHFTVCQKGLQPQTRTSGEVLEKARGPGRGGESCAHGAAAPAYRAPDARALRNMPKTAGGL
jgi:hypothetical protein